MPGKSDGVRLQDLSLRYKICCMKETRSRESLIWHGHVSELYGRIDKGGK